MKKKSLLLVLTLTLMLATIIPGSLYASDESIHSSTVSLSEEETPPKLDFDEETVQYLGLVDAIPTGTNYMLYENHGGDWSDAEKRPPDDGPGNPLPDNPGDEDDLMCWAASASNILEWTGWGLVGGMWNTDQMFQYFLDHWTDYGGLQEYGWDWWFDGTNPSQGWPGWSQVDVAGGNFWPAYNFLNYFHEEWGPSWQHNNLAMSAINTYLRNGWGVGLAIYTDAGGAHAITCWGYTYTGDSYDGVWVTDSDDYKNMADAPDVLRYYDVIYSTTNQRWHLRNYYGSNDWFIGGVFALEPFPNSRPVADADGPYTGYPSIPVTFDASGSTDANPLWYRWDFDNNGVWDTGWSTSPTASRTWYEEYTGTVKLQVYDGYTLDVDTALVNIVLPPPLKPVVTEIGRISLSIDGLGAYPEDSGSIEVEKPSGATVRSAYLAAATTGFRNKKLANGDIKLDGVGVVWSKEQASTIGSWNYWADVTEIVKAKIDAAPAGRVYINVKEELPSIEVDGVILAVIFDDPGQTTDNTIVLLFGSQDVNGDTFVIGFADPLDLSDPNLALDLSVGISYGAQGCSAGQYSRIDVNGNRMTTSAGGEDDGTCVNGALITVGGLDDSNANPADPYATPSGDPRIDDELYDLKPFVKTGDTSAQFYTLNPSNDDNIFFAGLYLASTAAVVGEGIVLTPASDTNPVGTTHTVVAKMQNDLGEPVVGREITFTVLSGPHAGMTYKQETDANGRASFTYTGTTTGIDVIVATALDSQGDPVASNRVAKRWIGLGPTIYGYAPWRGAAYKTFNVQNDVYCRGENYQPNDKVDVYLVRNVAVWQTGIKLGSLSVVRLLTDVQIDGVGNLQSTLVWPAPLVAGVYDLVADVDQDGIYTEGVDALEDNGVVASLAGIFVIPELPIGTLIGLIACIVALAVKSKNLL